MNLHIPELFPLLPSKTLQGHTPECSWRKNDIENLWELVSIRATPTRHFWNHLESTSPDCRGHPPQLHLLPVGHTSPNLTPHPTTLPLLDMKCMLLLLLLPTVTVQLPLCLLLLSQLPLIKVVCLLTTTTLGRLASTNSNMWRYTTPITQNSLVLVVVGVGLPVVVEEVEVEVGEVAIAPVVVAEELVVAVLVLVEVENASARHRHCPRLHQPPTLPRLPTNIPIRVR